MNGKHLLLLAALIVVASIVANILRGTGHIDEVPMIALVEFFVIGFGILEWRRRVMIRHKAERFDSRSDYDKSELFSEFQNSRLKPYEIHRALEAIERATCISKCKIRANDRFDKELAPEKGWEYDDGLALLALDLSKEFEVSAEVFCLEQNPTVSDLFCTLAKHLDLKQQARPANI